MLQTLLTPTRSSRVRVPPGGADWLHEIKHDGFRLMVQRAGARVRLFTRNGHAWAERYPVIVAAAAALQVRAPDDRDHPLRLIATTPLRLMQARSFLIDGEAVVADARGIASFNLLRRRARDRQAFVWAFDLLEFMARICAPCRWSVARFSCRPC